MTDIVERLRADEWAGTIAEEAADEIEQLRANEAAAIFSFRETNDMALEEIKQLREQLRAVLLHVADVRAQRNEQQP